MKIVVNKCYGGFSLSDEAFNALGLENRYDNIERTDKGLIALVEANPKGTNGYFADLVVVEIPDETTNWELNEYDGFESITYVVDGKLYHV